MLVGTPGRLIELIGTKGALSMARVTYAVIPYPSPNPNPNPNPSPNPDPNPDPTPTPNP